MRATARGYRLVDDDTDVDAIHLAALDREVGHAMAGCEPAQVAVAEPGLGLARDALDACPHLGRGRADTTPDAVRSLARVVETEVSVVFPWNRAWSPRYLNIASFPKSFEP